MKAALILAALCIFALLLPNFGRAFLDNFEKRLARIASSRWTVLWLALAILAFSVVLTIFYRLPQPRIHDEFSYLLQSDTFAHGRLTNPTHPLWRYFETFHELQQPTYASKYQPGQGLFLAFGQILWQPILGVWLSTALAIAALYWMLRALFNPAWSIAGAVLAALNTQVLWWNWSFWGGCVPMLGGALTLGGMFRTINKPSIPASIAMGVGAGVLAVTRPFEGIVLCACVAIVCLWSFWKTQPANVIVSVVLPIIVGAVPFITFDLIYNYRVTGHALTPPYSIYEKTYSRNALLIWQKDPENDRNHRPEINRFYDDEKRDANMQRSLSGFIRGLWPKLKLYDRYFLHGLLALMIIPALATCGKAFGLRQSSGAFRQPRTTVLICTAIFSFCLLITLCSSFWAQPHYSAPILPLFVALVLYGFAGLHATDRTRLLARVLFFGFCLLGLSMFTARLWKDQKTQWQYKRADFVARLKQSPHKQLVLVHYAPKHNPKTEWIYNRADLDDAQVVFAPDGDAEYLKPLLTYFKGYETNHIEPDRPMWGD